MPSERFFKLPVEKREKIHAAAMQEFCTVPMEHVSINRIVQAAGISRGSFYTYFEDKQDVLQYLMQESRARENAYSCQSLLDSKGDIWKTADLMLEYALEQLQKSNVFDLTKNIAVRDGLNPFNEIRKWKAVSAAKQNEEKVKHWEEAEQALLNGAVYRGKTEDCFDEEEALEYFFWKHADKSKLNVPDFETMKALVFQCRLTVMVTVARILLAPEQKDEAYKMYHRSIQILQEGVLRK